MWCIVLKNKDTKEVHRFYPNSPLSGHVDFEKEFHDFIRSNDVFIGHNIVGYDFQLINTLLKTGITLDQLIDTLVLSRLFRPVSPFADTPMDGLDNRVGGHSLEAWGKRLGIHKGDYNDWSKFTMQMLEYCEQDVNVTEAIYNYLMEKEAEGFSQHSIDLEHRVAHLLSIQEQNGFFLDQDEARKLLENTSIKLAEMDKTFDELFPPIKKYVRTLKIKRTKEGLVPKTSEKVIQRYGENAVLVDKDTYNLYETEVFNAQSGTQIGERLLTLGWKPKKFTPTGKPKTDKDTLSEAIEELSQFPQIQALSQYNIIADRNQKAEKWLSLVKEDQRVHGRINPIGAGTHRCSHFDDNMANIARVVNGDIPLEEFILHHGDPSKYKQWDTVSDEIIFNKVKGDKVLVIWKGLKGKYGWESRNCWAAPEGKILVGSDASGIQLRALAHYMNDPVYTKLLIEDDIHVVHQIAAGITANEFMSARDVAKRFIYAWLLGAGDEKVGIVVGVDPKEYDELYDWAGGLKGVKKIVNGLKFKGRKADKRTVYNIIKGKKIKQQFLDRTPALKRLKEEEIPKVVKQGYLVGIDGRKFHIPNAHLAMSFYLQGFEAIIMKQSMALFDDEMKRLMIPYKQTAFTHDEFEDEVDPEFAEITGKTRVWSIEEAGRMLGSNCPLTGDYRIGSSWAKVH